MTKKKAFFPVPPEVKIPLPNSLSAFQRASQKSNLLIKGLIITLNLKPTTPIQSPKKKLLSLFSMLKRKIRIRNP